MEPGSLLLIVQGGQPGSSAVTPPSSLSALLEEGSTIDLTRKVHAIQYNAPWNLIIFAAESLPLIQALSSSPVPTKFVPRARFRTPIPNGMEDAEVKIRSCNRVKVSRRVVRGPAAAIVCDVMVRLPTLALEKQADCMHFLCLVLRGMCRYCQAHRNRPDGNRPLQLHLHLGTGNLNQGEAESFAGWYLARNPILFPENDPGIHVRL
ncbi:hypothetical protein B0T26DRAFT_509411 [Lasiosphaeria miniovina]|uniref:Uncharacterized protein n=1 Tax=Lasiosphaeria miniovina TaxID=1954250 RepID=A0AA40DK34_9PEZI|nr:uncharacterized protein B0T26DRAFT_509411 [Lasiosphaeria miniovina]KAK0703717.1 hypothetical protein B0T26DRAFT_509411 [Lasiosphaeria miniovina]